MALVMMPDAQAQYALPQIEGLALHEVQIPSSVDGKPQPLVIGVPAQDAAGAPRPLLVGLHTWSSEYLQTVPEYGEQAARRGWLLVCPHFRGPNLTTNPAAREAGGSILAQHDIIDAIAYMKAHYAVDPRRIYLVGASGGGHMTCLMACKYPDVFAACTAWCPITDLRDWHAQGNSYAPHVEAVCGGPPGASAQVDFEYLRRSPRTFLTNAAPCNLFIGHGDKDPTIWPEQTWTSFRVLKDIPQHRVLFHSWSGGHEAKTTEGLNWAAEHALSDTPPHRLDIVTDEAKAYFWLWLQPAAPLTLARCTAILVSAPEPAGPASVTLQLSTQDVAALRVDFGALGLRTPTTLPEGVSVEGGRLSWMPGAGRHECKIAFP
jgi:poly(3-hydroxybutyrate) depolymerase